MEGKGERKSRKREEEKQPHYQRLYDTFITYTNAAPDKKF